MVLFDNVAGMGFFLRLFPYITCGDKLIFKLQKGLRALLKFNCLVSSARESKEGKEDDSKLINICLSKLAEAKEGNIEKIDSIILGLVERRVLSIPVWQIPLPHSANELCKFITPSFIEKNLYLSIPAEYRRTHFTQQGKIRKNYERTVVEAVIDAFYLPYFSEFVKWSSAERRMYMQECILQKEKKVESNFCSMLHGKNFSPLSMDDREVMFYWWKGNMAVLHTAAGKEINCFSVDEEKVVLPFYTRKLLEDYPSPSPSLIGDTKGEMKFTASLRPIQEENVLIANKHFEMYSACLLALPTGSGKTVYGAYYACKWNTYTCVVYPLTPLGKQWKETFDKMTNCTSWIVEDEEIPEEQPNVIICFGERSKKIPTEWIEKVKFLIVDEAHAMCTNTRIKSILSFTPDRILLETATPDRTDGMSLFLYFLTGCRSIVSKNILCAPYDKGVNTLSHIIEGVIDKNFTVYKYNTGIVPPREYVNRITPWSGGKKIQIVNWASLVNSITQDEKRNMLICDLIKQWSVDNNKHVLCLGRSKDQPVILSETLSSQGIHADFFTGSKKSYDTSCKVLLGSFSKIGTGFDDVRFEVLIITASIKDKNAMQQIFGRIRLREVTLIYMVDEDPTIQKHWDIANKWLVDKGALITDIGVKKIDPYADMY